MTGAGAGVDGAAAGIAVGYLSMTTPTNIRGIVFNLTRGVKDSKL